MTTRRRLGWMELIEGILLIALGIVTLVRPRGALTTLVAAYGVIALLTGLVDIAFYIVMEKHTGFGPTISLVTGILSVLAGCALIAHPEIGLNLLLIIFPVWFGHRASGRGQVQLLSDADGQHRRHRAQRDDAV